MQSPPPIRVAGVAPATTTVAVSASASARDTATALEALLEIKNSPPSAFGTPTLQVPIPATAAASATSRVANLQIPTTIHVPTAGAVTGTSRPTPMHLNAASAMLPSHLLLAPRRHRQTEISAPTSAVMICNHPTSTTGSNASGRLVPPGAKALHSTINSPSHLPIAGTAAVVSPPTSTSPAKSPTSPTSVREEEIKAALTSKPQRGKKRDNLTAEERKELTKTRNREHARTTRIRKKARNDELLAIEAKYQELMKREKLDQERRDCIREFFAIRTEMLTRALSPTSTEDKNSKQVCTSSSLDKVIENQWLFDVSTLTPRRNTESGIAPLCKFDEVMANSIKSKYPAPNVTYNIGTDSIAIVNDNAITLAEIIDQLTQEVIVTLTVQFKFGSGLSKIRSLSWSASSSLGNGENIMGTYHLQAKQQEEEKPAPLPSIVSMHSVSTLDRTSPITGVTTDVRKLSE